MIKYILLLLFLMLTPLQALSMNYSNATAEQEGNYLVLYFDITGNENQEAVVGVQVKTKTQIFSTRQLHLEGDVGLVSVGKNKKIYWDVFKDFPKGLPKGSKWSLLVRPTHYTNQLGMKFVYIPSGCYEMGASKLDKFAKKDEYPRHKVCLHDFFIGQYEITNEQFKMFDKTHDSGKSKLYNLNKPNLPVVNVSWDEISKYVTWLYGKTGEIYRLPTEAEWEYAARAGVRKDVFWNSPKDACKYANVYDLTAEKNLSSYAMQKPFPCKDNYVATAPVGSFLPNRFELYDMIGNAAEWCYDTYYAKAYKISKKDNPVYLNPYISLAKSVRGGSWYSTIRYTRLSARSNNMPGLINDFTGFRLILEP